MKPVMIGAAMAAAAWSLAPAHAASFSAAYVFGDSLSDNGNVADAVSHPLPTPPFAFNSFTNGKVAVEVMAEKFGLVSAPSLFPPSAANPSNSNFITSAGTNYAFAGATAGATFGQGQPLGNLGTQIAAYLVKKPVADANALYTVFIGGNDVRSAAQTNDSKYITDGLTAEAAAITQLLGTGVKHLLVVNVPDIGKIPEYTAKSATDANIASTFTKEYNDRLTSALTPIIAANAQAKIYQFDLFDYDAMLRGSAGNLGITNITDPCYISYGGVTNNNPLVITPACGAIDPATKQASNIGSFYYWDDHHPTANVQAALGDALYGFVEASEAPEPASWAMMLTGFALTGAALRRRRTAMAIA